MENRNRESGKDVVKRLIAEDGWKGLYRGLGPRFVSMSTWGTSMILAYEYLSKCMLPFLFQGICCEPSSTSIYLLSFEDFVRLSFSLMKLCPLFLENKLTGANLNACVYSHTRRGCFSIILLMENQKKM